MVRRDGPLIVQNDRTVLLDVHHPGAEGARETLGLTPRQLDLVRAEGKKYIQSMGA